MGSKPAKPLTIEDVNDKLIKSLNKMLKRQELMKQELKKQELKIIRLKGEESMIVRLKDEELKIKEPNGEESKGEEVKKWELNTAQIDIIKQYFALYHEKSLDYNLERFQRDLTAVESAGLTPQEKMNLAAVADDRFAQFVKKLNKSNSEQEVPMEQENSPLVSKYSSGQAQYRKLTPSSDTSKQNRTAKKYWLQSPHQLSEDHVSSPQTVYPRNTADILTKPRLLSSLFIKDN